MSRITSYANVLREFVYDPEVQLINQSPGEIPCFYCVCNIYRDLSLRCCAGASPKCCVFCADDRKKCGSIFPRKYFSAVQAYYLAIERLQDRFADKELDPTQV
ncbi:hypothetical protein F25303_14541 [Fusarium sp. NRRL 25303]|nr:hypothetical protein F25303_14541 [Fusarium sp. NRRL 25303]